MTQVIPHEASASLPGKTPYKTASYPQSIDDAQLMAELETLGIHFLQSSSTVELATRIAPATLVARLASSNEARVRLALIPLLLHRPDFAAYLNAALQITDATAQVFLKCYYTAALYLQQKYRQRLQKLTGQYTVLPDVFSAELGLRAVANPDDGLQLLAQRQAVLSGKRINWLGTYEHAAQRWLTSLEHKQKWRI